jgi:threonine dehydrogenase-like Zn-dependent dehydrogenase
VTSGPGVRAVVIQGTWAPRGSKAPDARAAPPGNRAWRWPQVSVQTVPLRPPGPGEVLVRVAACGLCGSDRALCAEDEDGYMRYAGRVRLPLVPGHEFAGVVVEVGPGVHRVRPGDAVTCDNIVACGHCASCRAGATNQCASVEEIGFTKPGGLAEYAIVPERCCFDANPIVQALGAGDGYRVAALLEPAAVAYQGLFLEAGGVPAGGTVVVYGAGVVGLSCAALARAAGAGQVLVFKRRPGGEDLARAVGAEVVYAWDELQRQGRRPADVVRELTAGHGAELQVEASGALQATVPEMLEALAPRGTVLLLGRQAGAVPVELDRLVSAAGRVVGSLGHAGERTFPPLVERVARGELPLGALVARVVTLDQTPQVLQERLPPAGKTLVEPAGRVA